MWTSYQFDQFVDINPIIKLKQGEKYSFIEMKDIDEKIRYCEPAQEKILSGGSRFINGDTLFARITPCLENGKIAQVRNLKNNVGFGSTEFLVFREKRYISNSNFIFYLSKWEEVKNFAEINLEGTSGRQRVNKNCFSTLSLLLPPLAEQKAIAAVLGSLDDKIDLLHRQNATLERMAETLFRQWFIEEAQEDWEEKKLGDFFPVITGKKDANFSTDDGKYPFFTCSKAVLKAPDYSFEGHAILLSGNGDFNVKRYIGKFEAYQRTYVLIPYKPKLLNLLYIIIKHFLTDITSEHRGSVINFITKGMITNFTFRIPTPLPINIIDSINTIFDKIDSNNMQIQTLEKLRDTLLPKLMSGEVRVRVDE